MAIASIRFPKKFENELAKYGDKLEPAIDKALEAGGAVMKDKIGSGLAAVVGKETKLESRSTGELVDSLGVSPPDTDFKGIRNVHVGFNEPRREQNMPKGKRSYIVRTNAMIANVLEYGKHGQPPKPFLAPAKASGRAAALDAMKAVLESELKQ